MAREVPDELWLVESFLNSVDVESGQDDLDSVPRFRRWLRDHGRPAAAAQLTAADLELARELRAGLRHVVRAHGEPDSGGVHSGGADADGADPDGADPGGIARVDALAGRVPLRARFAGGGVTLAPAAAGVAGVLGEVLGAVALADRGGAWRRLKLCRDGGCQQVFYDRSKNGSRCWCSMEVCGNRSKTRAYRTRRRTGPPSSAERAG